MLEGPSSRCFITWDTRVPHVTCRLLGPEDLVTTGNGKPVPCKGPAGLLKMEDRSGLRSTVVASQLPVDKWHPSMADPTLADVLLY